MGMEVPLKDAYKKEGEDAETQGNSSPVPEGGDKGKDK